MGRGRIHRCSSTVGPRLSARAFPASAPPNRSQYEGMLAAKSWVSVGGVVHVPGGWSACEVFAGAMCSNEQHLNDGVPWAML
jgi:hypothetical protein